MRHTVENGIEFSVDIQFFVDVEFVIASVEFEWTLNSV